MEMQDELVMQLEVESALNELSSAIAAVFGFDPYPWQRDVFMKCLSTQQDIIVSAATSDGKSLCYQGMVFCHSKATVIVISPTKSLMDDQVRDPKHQSR
jgi:superfamily II DNA helicase RecQ